MRTSASLAAVLLSVFLYGCEGPQGPVGPQGEGKQGPQGEKGEQGPPGNLAIRTESAPCPQSCTLVAVIMSDCSARMWSGALELQSIRASNRLSSTTAGRVVLVQR
jgi:hypothetical protein